MRRAWVMALVAMGLAAALAAVAGAANPPAPSQPPGSGPVRTVTDVLNRAIQRTYALHPECRPASPFDRPTTFTDDAPRQATLETYALLRRPARAGDVAPDASLSGVPAEGVYRQYERIGITASGRRVRIVVARRTQFYEPPSNACVRALRRRFARVVAHLDRSARFERRARRTFGGYVRAITAPAPPADQDGLFVFSGGGGGGGTPVALARENGVFLGSFSTRRGGRLTGLIPDGVAAIRFHFRGHRARTAAVRENVISIAVRGTGERALSPRMDWLDADGGVLRVVPGA
jgi:hypothetical protein